MRIECLSLDEIQRLRLSYRLTTISDLLEIPIKDVYYLFSELEISSPSEYVRDYLEKERERFLEESGSIGQDRFIERYGVSISFLRSLFKDPNCFSGKMLQDQVNRFGSTTLVRKMYNFRGKLFPPDPKSRFRALGNMNSSVGRRAEELVLSLFPKAQDMNLEDPTANFDFFIPEYGRVNVKAVRGTSSWRAPLTNNCDFVALVAMDREGIPLFIEMVEQNRLPLRLKRPSLNGIELVKRLYL